MKKAKTTIAALTLMVIMALSSAFTSFKNGKVIMIVSIEVKNFAEWKKMFDAGAPIREKAGIKVVSICTSPENGKVVVIEEAESLKAAEDFLSVLKSKQKDGDIAKLEVKIFDKVE